MKTLSNIPSSVSDSLLSVVFSHDKASGTMCNLLGLW